VLLPRGNLIAARAELMRKFTVLGPIGEQRSDPVSSINLKTLGVPASPGFLGDYLTGLLGGSVSPPAAPASGGPFSTIYAFGDSLSDVGNIANVTGHLLPAAPYVDGHFTNGPVWVQDLATQLGLPSPNASTLGGTDYAYGGAETGRDTLHAQNPSDLPSQFVQFAVSHPQPQPNALYTLSIGSNDVLDAISAYPTNPVGATTDITNAVQNETNFVSALASRGAHNFVVLNVPDLGDTPAETAQGPQVAQIAAALSATYDTQLSAALGSLATADHLNLHIVDTYALLDEAIASPAAFGLTNVTQPVWTGNYYNPASGVLNATGTAQNGYLFFDSLHPTATGHAVLAAAAQTSLQSTV
jgi:phospholipase/lecithinase/hemolysin